MEKTIKVISERILELVAGGMELRDAFDAVLGAGKFEALASDLHDKFNRMANA